MRSYCTYFDQNYIPRALVLLTSMLAHCGKFKLYALCLDERTFEVIAKLDYAQLVPIRVSDLEAVDAELAATKPTRSKVEYYFTITPAWLLYLFDRYPEIDFLTYVDSDMCFFADPEPVYAEIGTRSIAITPHRFSPDRAGLIQYGRFNVGWMSYRRDEAGLECLRWYRARCIEWCYDRIEGERFADQKYLDRFPELFRQVAIVAHKGVNLAPYNVNNYEVTEAGGRIMVDDQPLLCYHFHSVREITPGNFQFVLDGKHGAKDGVVYRVLYADYINQLAQIVQQLRPIFPEAQLSRTERDAGSIRPPAPPPWEYRPRGWTDNANELGGWNAESVVAARQRDWVPYLARLASTGRLGDGHDHNNIMSFAYALGLAARERKKISVLDWGGVFGAHYKIAHALYPDLELDYTCKEVPLICRHGRELNPEIRFVESDDEALERRYDFVFVSSTLQYEKNWVELARRLAAATAGYLFVTRTPIVEAADSFVVVQRTPAFGSAYQGWFINRRALLATLTKAGMALVREFQVMESFPVPGAPEAGQGYGCLMRPVLAAA